MPGQLIAMASQATRLHASGFTESIKPAPVLNAGEPNHNAQTLADCCVLARCAKRGPMAKFIVSAAPARRRKSSPIQSPALIPSKPAGQSRRISRARSDRRRRALHQRQCDLHVVMIDTSEHGTLECQLGEGCDDEHEHLPRRPPIRHDSAATADITAHSQRSGHTARIIRSARSASAKLRAIQNTAARPASIRRDQCHRQAPAGGSSRYFVQIEPAAPGNKFTHLHKPHGIFGIKQPQRHFLPALGKQAQGCCGPCQSQQQRKRKLTFRKS